VGSDLGPVVAEKAGGTLLTEIFLQASRIRIPQINNDQAVQDIGEAAVHIEGQNLSSDFQVLAQQNGKSFAIQLKILYRS